MENEIHWKKELENWENLLAWYGLNFHQPIAIWHTFFNELACSFYVLSCYFDYIEQIFIKRMNNFPIISFATAISAQSIEYSIMHHSHCHRNKILQKYLFLRNGCQSVWGNNLQSTYLHDLQRYKWFNLWKGVFGWLRRRTPNAKEETISSPPSANWVHIIIKHVKFCKCYMQWLALYACNTDTFSLLELCKLCAL